MHNEHVFFVKSMDDFDKKIIELTNDLRELKKMEKVNLETLKKNNMAQKLSLLVKFLNS